MSALDGRLMLAAVFGLVFSLFVSTAVYGAAEKGPRCSDGIDNDGDGLIDTADPSCGQVVEAVCNADAVLVGDACVDKFEASVWRTTNVDVIDQIRKGQINAVENFGGAAAQLGAQVDNYGAACPNNADGCIDVYAVSMPGVIPADNITWFQASAACRNSGKRLVTNYEWQMAAYGTPDTGIEDGVSSCRVAGGTSIETGARAACVSDVGAYDMVGNLWEWVAEWWPQVIGNDGSGCLSGWGGFSDDYNCGGVNVTSSGPAALLRGGWAQGNQTPGPLAIAVTRGPETENINVGFRCARNR